MNTQNNSTSNESKNNNARILEILKRSGSQTAKELAVELEMTSMGARLLLLNLKEKSLVTDFDRAEKVGRPSKYWKLTEKGHREFPDRHSELTLQMIDSVKTLFGDEGLEKLIQDREQKMRSQYSASMAMISDLEKKIHQLAELRTQEGYMAEVEKLDHDNWLLIENHCPICAAATQCQNFCRSELTVFQQCLGPKFEISRKEHLLNESHRCVYLISAKTN